MNQKRPTFEFQGSPHVARVVPTPPTDETVAVQPTQPSMQVDDTKQVRLVPRETAVDESQPVRVGLNLRQLFDRIVAEWKQAKLTITLALAVGIVIGLPVLGWGLWPVEWTGGSYADLSPQYQQAVVDMAADLAAYDPTSPAVVRVTHLYPGIELEICRQANNTADVNKQQRLRFLNFKVTGADCTRTVE